MGCLRRISLLLPLCFLISVVSGSAQLQPEPSDPLARIRDAVKNNVQACSATGVTLCEQVAPKIVANAEGDSPLVLNLQRWSEVERSQVPTSRGSEPAEVAWAVAAFRSANVDVQLEKHPLALDPHETYPREGFDVVAEIRGREKPDEWVLLGADDFSHCQYPVYNSLSVIEAARAIELTGIHPRRSIRFVLFGLGGFGSFHYVRAHRDELNRASVAIILCAGANPVNGFILNGRHDIEPGVREALKPIYAMGVAHHRFDAPPEYYSLAFILEGIPTLLTPPAEWTERSSTDDVVKASSPDKAAIGQLKRNIAIAAVAAFDIAERAEPLGPRQSRSEVELLLKATGLEQSMKSGKLWDWWQSGKLGSEGSAPTVKRLAK